LDFNLGCSAYAYGLSIADGLIQSGVAKRILFITAETYTKMIDVSDRSLRTIFSDAASATLIESHDQPSIWGYQFGTDGKGADTLLATEKGFRCQGNAIEPRHRKRWKSDLYMDGPALISFTMEKVPLLVNKVLEDSGLTRDEVGYYLLHQATWKMLDQLRIQLELDEARFPIMLEEVGNTVSSTIPILIQQLRDNRSLTPEMKNLIIGFGVGWSWSGCAWQDILQP
jgi:3-oxoacyl-[acyl-carrier-protein] synthase-3